MQTVQLSVILTDGLPLALVEDFAVAPIHVGHVDCVAIGPVDFPVRGGVTCVVSDPVMHKLSCS